VLGWRVIDIVAAIQGLNAIGVVSCATTVWIKTTTVSGVTPAGEKMAWFADPEGNILSLTQPQ